MGQALYRKYRSKAFDEVVGQEHVTETLKNALKTGRISHAYLFTGPRGVGKTSVARILAHEVNELPYDDETMHLDIIEIDAASNRRIDEIRDLREKVHVAPTSAKYKVYIIDEVHMLTREAFNALLKTLEEPPAHCIFILATTEAHKLPETIISRTQRFNFKPVDDSSATGHLSNIAKKEKITIEPQALQLIAEHGEGSFRDSIGILDQLSSLDNKVTVEAARHFLGLPPDEAINDLISAIELGDSQKALQTLTSLKDQGTNAAKVASRLAKNLRQKLIRNQAGPWVPTLLRQLLLVPSSPSPYDQLEISVLESTGRQDAVETKTVVVDDSAEIKEKEERPKPPKPESKPQKEEAKTEEVPAQEVKNGKIHPSNSDANFDLSIWPQIVTKVKEQAASLYTALRLAQPSMVEGTLVLAFQFPLHQKKVSQAKNLDIIGKAIEDTAGIKLRINCIVDKNVLPPPIKESVIPKADLPQSEKNNSPLKTISNIFGAAEVLES